MVEVAVEPTGDKVDEVKTPPKGKAAPAISQKDFDDFKSNINQTVTRLQKEVATERTRADTAEATARDWEDFPDDSDKRRDAEVKRAADRIYGDKLAELDQAKLELKAKELRMEYKDLPPDMFMAVTSALEMENKALRWAAEHNTPAATEPTGDNPNPEPTANPSGNVQGEPGSNGAQDLVNRLASGKAMTTQEIVTARDAMENNNIFPTEGKIGSEPAAV